MGRNLGTVEWRVDRGCSGWLQIDGGYAHQSEDPDRHQRAACGGSLAAVFGRRAVMVRALWDDVPRREGGSNGAKVASGGSDRRGTYVFGGGK